MGKSLIILLIVLLSLTVIAATDNYRYNPYTANKDYWKGYNDSDFIPTNGSINSTSHWNNLSSYNTTTLAEDDSRNLTVRQSWLESLFYSILQIEAFNNTLNELYYLRTALYNKSEIESFNNTLIQKKEIVTNNSHATFLDVTANNLIGNISSKYVKDPPVSCSSGYAMTQFGPDNFSQVTCSDYWINDGETYLRSETYNNSQIEGLNDSINSKVNQINNTKLNKTSQFGGDVTGTYDSISVNDNSHTHYTQNITDFNSSVSTLLNGTVYYPTSYNELEGTIVAGGNNLGNLSYYDNQPLNITEGNGANSILFDVNFTGVEKFNTIVAREYYVGGASHQINIMIWDSLLSDWENYYTFVGQAGYNTISIPVLDTIDHIVSGNVRVRFDHIENGVSSHKLAIDYVQLISGYNILNTEGSKADILYVNLVQSNLSERINQLNSSLWNVQDNLSARVNQLNSSSISINSINQLNQTKANITYTDLVQSNLSLRINQVNTTILNEHAKVGNYFNKTETSAQLNRTDNITALERNLTNILNSGNCSKVVGFYNNGTTACETDATGGIAELPEVANFSFVNTSEINVTKLLFFNGSHQTEFSTAFGMPYFQCDKEGSTCYFVITNKFSRGQYNTGLIVFGNGSTEDSFSAYDYGIFEYTNGKYSISTTLKNLSIGVAGTSLIELDDKDNVTISNGINTYLDCSQVKGSCFAGVNDFNSLHSKFGGYPNDTQINALSSKTNSSYETLFTSIHNKQGGYFNSTEQTTWQTKNNNTWENNNNTLYSFINGLASKLGSYFNITETDVYSVKINNTIVNSTIIRTDKPNPSFNVSATSPYTCFYQSSDEVTYCVGIDATNFCYNIYINSVSQANIIFSSCSTYSSSSKLFKANNGLQFTGGLNGTGGVHLQETDFSNNVHLNGNNIDEVGDISLNTITTRGITGTNGLISINDSSGKEHLLNFTNGIYLGHTVNDYGSKFASVRLTSDSIATMNHTAVGNGSSLNYTNGNITWDNTSKYFIIGRSGWYSITANIVSETLTTGLFTSIVLVNNVIKTQATYTINSAVDPQPVPINYFDYLNKGDIVNVTKYNGYIGATFELGSTIIIREES